MVEFHLLKDHPAKTELRPHPPHLDLSSNRSTRPKRRKTRSKMQPGCSARKGSYHPGEARAEAFRGFVSRDPVAPWKSNGSEVQNQKPAAICNGNASDQWTPNWGLICWLYNVLSAVVSASCICCFQPIQSAMSPRESTCQVLSANHQWSFVDIVGKELAQSQWHQHVTAQSSPGQVGNLQSLVDHLGYGINLSWLLLGLDDPSRIFGPSELTKYDFTDRDEIRAEHQNLFIASCGVFSCINQVKALILRGVL